MKRMRSWPRKLSRTVGLRELVLIEIDFDAKIVVLCLHSNTGLKERTYSLLSQSEGKNKELKTCDATNFRESNILASKNVKTMWPHKAFAPDAVIKQKLYTDIVRCG